MERHSEMKPLEYGFSDAHKVAIKDSLQLEEEKPTVNCLTSTGSNLDMSRPRHVLSLGYDRHNHCLEQKDMESKLESEKHDTKNFIKADPEHSRGCLVGFGQDSAASGGIELQRVFRSESAQNKNSALSGDGFTKSKKQKAGSVVKQFSCTICGRTFNRANNLSRHNQTHSDERPYICSVCGKSYKTTEDVRRHRCLHSGDKPICCCCDRCGKSFKAMEDFQRHRRTHTGEKPFSCPFCTNTFRQSAHLKQHIETHSEGVDLQKPYHCERCGKPFAHVVFLRRHLKMAHLNQKKHHCDLCGKAFTRAGDLTRHRHSHSGIKPYRCQFCSKDFSYSSSLKVHIKTHLGC